ncbi:HLA class II histocompatibility antigen, DRB1-15 beta chain-like isoform X2 [Sus scrofa]|uniref:HLA class II histocompatibility antigen, DRB1-15 beta chain-like isoform X2 n=1 Tax=Sus scrofa TaxID=9823 RepID=UPI000A2B9956|nr:HLA class II histocompatibility antigen, DRB1-15 beta chain-like isoform X2 [Sus scrofa]
MVRHWSPGSSWTVFLTVILMVLSPPLAWAGDTRLFMIQGKSECHFSNGRQQVRFLDRYIYNRDELVRFDSDVGEYRAVTPMGQPAAKYWNSQKDILKRVRAAVDTFCRSNYEFFESCTVQRRGEQGGWATRGGYACACVCVSQTERLRQTEPEVRA